MAAYNKRMQLHSNKLNLMSYIVPQTTTSFTIYVIINTIHYRYRASYVSDVVFLSLKDNHQHILCYDCHQQILCYDCFYQT